MKRFYTLLAELDGQGNDLDGGGLDLSPREQEIMDQAQGKIPAGSNEDDDEPIELPSDKIEDDDDNPEPSKEGFVDGKYADVDALKKGISELGSDLPEYILNGMNDEALEQHYIELRKNFSSGKKQEPVKEDGDAPTEDDAKKAVESADLDWDAVGQEFALNGDISADTRQSLKDANIPEIAIDMYIKGVKAEQDAAKQEVYDIAGGQEQYDAIKTWADEGGIPKAELDALQGLSREQLITAMYGIKARYEAANPDKPTLMTGKTQRVTSDSYKNQAQYIADITDPRYRSDRKYKQIVDDKFKNSKALQ